LKESACNLQAAIHLFDILFTGLIFPSGKQPIPHTMERFTDNCPLSDYQHRLNQKDAVESGAQHMTLRGRELIYKNMQLLYTGPDWLYIQVHATCNDILGQAKKRSSLARNSFSDNTGIVTHSPPRRYSHSSVSSR
jgi:hypothetical protein